jgi:hypothetical protein
MDSELRDIPDPECFVHKQSMFWTTVLGTNEAQRHHWESACISLYVNWKWLGVLLRMLRTARLPPFVY